MLMLYAFVLPILRDGVAASTPGRGGEMFSHCFIPPQYPARSTAAFFFCFSFSSSGGWVKIKLKLPHFHVSDTCRVSI